MRRPRGPAAVGRYYSTARQSNGLMWFPRFGWLPLPKAFNKKSGSGVPIPPRAYTVPSIPGSGSENGVRCHRGDHPN
jgi:hypothetical protein